MKIFAGPVAILCSGWTSAFASDALHFICTLFPTLPAVAIIPLKIYAGIAAA